MRPGAAAAATKRFRKVLLLVSELHVRGYQRIRIAPGMSPSGLYWRCSIAPVSLIGPSGIELLNSEFKSKPVPRYTTVDEGKYFGWMDAVRATPSGLARRFIERFPQIVEAGRGADWTYVGWYIEMLHLTYPDLLPIAYDDQGGGLTHQGVEVVRIGGGHETRLIPLPPPPPA